MMSALKQMRTNKALRNREIAGYLFAMPAILGFLVYCITPILLSLRYSLSDFSVFKKEIEFIGLANYRRLFSGTDPLFWKSIQATVLYVVLNVPFTMVVSYILALLLNKNIKGRGFLRGVFYMPSIVPAVAACMIWQYLVNYDMGIFNGILKSLGLPKLKFLTSTTTVIPTLVMTNLWNCGGPMVIYLASLQNIPRHYYESIEVDGGNGWHKLRYITIPLSTPIIFYNTLMCTISSFQEFTKAYILTDGGPDNSSRFICYYIYTEAFQNARMANACALGWVLFLMTGAFSIMYFRMQNKWVNYV